MATTHPRTRNAKSGQRRNPIVEARGHKATGRIKVALRPQPGSDDHQQKTNSFLIVGVGASAGGLEAFSQFLGALPYKPAMAFILVQHLDPQHQSMLTDILSKTSKMPVHEAKEGVAVQPDCIYVIPPNTSMAIFQGKLRLTPPISFPASILAG